MRLEVISRFRLLLSQLELNDQDHHPPIPTLNTVSNESDIINDSNYETNNGEPIENNVHEIGNFLNFFKYRYIFILIQTLLK
jgi:hypothetical protein